jgi:hypothetical protein
METAWKVESAWFEIESARFLIIARPRPSLIHLLQQALKHVQVAA